MEKKHYKNKKVNWLVVLHEKYYSRKDNELGETKRTMYMATNKIDAELYVANNKHLEYDDSDSDYYDFVNYGKLEIIKA